jgi:hypothetical protein
VVHFGENEDIAKYHHPHAAMADTVAKASNFSFNVIAIGSAFGGSRDHVAPATLATFRLTRMDKDHGGAESPDCG